MKKKKRQTGSSLHGSADTNPTSPWGHGLNHWPCSVGQRSAIAVSCDVGGRDGSDLALLWLWCQPAAAALIRTLSLGASVCLGCGPKKKTNLHCHWPFLCISPLNDLYPWSCSIVSNWVVRIEVKFPWFCPVAPAEEWSAVCQRLSWARRPRPPGGSAQWPGWGSHCHRW